MQLSHLSSSHMVKYLKQKRLTDHSFSFNAIFPGLGYVDVAHGAIQQTPLNPIKQLKLIKRGNANVITVSYLLQNSE